MRGTVVHVRRLISARRARSSRSPGGDRWSRRQLFIELNAADNAGIQAFPRAGFPPREYKFVGTTVERDELRDAATLSHDIPTR